MTYSEDHLFCLTKKGMMIRFAAVQTKETRGKATKGTRIMNVREKDTKKIVDELIFTARLPGELVYKDPENPDSEEIEISEIQGEEE